jgi:GntR family transcriptional regulator, transcriptional repressor for pyruvate dehydrogenase complex
MRESLAQMKLLSATNGSASTLAASLREDILASRYPPGTRLYTLRDLQQRSGYSLSVVREALQLLQATGLITVRQGAKGGVMVRESNHDIVTQSLDALIASSDISPEIVFESRQELEGICAAMAAHHATDDQLTELAESIERARSLTDKPVQFSLENVTFHRAVSAATANPAIMAVSAALSELFFRETTQVVYSQAALQATVGAHTRILTAIKNHDADAARASMTRHVDGFKEYMYQTRQIRSNR